MTIEFKISFASLLAALAVLALALPAAAQPRLLANVNDVVSGEPGSGIQLLGNLDDGRLIFSAFDLEQGRDLWITDGTSGGTRRIVDLLPGGLTALFDGAGATEGHVYFLFRGMGSETDDLWTTDGTAEGTRKLLSGFRLSQQRPAVTTVDDAGRLFVLAFDAAERGGLWVSDGTPQGSRRLALPNLTADGVGTFIGSTPGGVVFSASTGPGGSLETWGSDGTDAGTRRLPLGPPLRTDSARLPGGDLLVVVFAGVDEPPEAWRTDGTPEGTSFVLSVDRFVEPLVAATDRVWFRMRQAEFGQELWSTDGTTAEKLSLDLGTASIGKPLAVGERVFFGVNTFPSQLWVADANGAERIHDYTPGSGVLGDSRTPLGDGVAWMAAADVGEIDLWFSDGTKAGTRRVERVCSGCPNFRTRFAGSFDLRGKERLFITTQAADLLLVSDGTASGTETLIAPGSGVRLTPRPFASVSGGVVFEADDGLHGAEPWFTDGRPAGTRLLADLATTRRDGSAFPRGLLRHDDGFLFAAHDGESWGLWTSRGDEASTRRLAPLPSLTQVPLRELPPLPLLVNGGSVYVALHASGTESRLVRVDLSNGRLIDLAAIGVLEGSAYFGALAVGPRALFDFASYTVSDGTAAGTSPDFGEERFQPDRGFVSLDGGTVLFSARAKEGQFAVAGDQLWRTDGTVAGTFPIFVPDPEAQPTIIDLGAEAGVAFFGLAIERQGERVAELWTTDGTAAGTRRVRSFTGDGFPTGIYPRGSGAFFFLFYFPERTELWWTDGTAAGTRPVATHDERGRPFVASSITRFGDGLLFHAADPVHGEEPWVSDGTASGTRRLVDLRPGPEGSAPRRFVVAGERAFFVAFDGQRLRLWATDGTPSGTFPADSATPPASPSGTLEVVPLDDRVVYVAVEARTGQELWVVHYDDLLAATPPVAPAGLGLVAGEVASLTWLDRSDDETGFAVEAKSPADAAFREIVRLPANRVSVDLPDLPRGVPHTFRVRAVNGFGASPPSNEVSVLPRAAPDDDCTPSADHLCLLGDRFLVRLFWRDPRSGDHGQANAVPLAGNDRSGTFWFFRPENVETIVKVLDGRGVNQRYWVFTGGLTDVERWLQVVDTANGDEQVYRQPAGELCGFGDTGAFAGGPSVARPATARTTAAAEAGDALGLFSDRFEVTVDWRDPRSGDTGTGQPIPGGDNSGYFWFFNEQNVELVVKVLDGEPVNGNLWFFYGGLSDVEYTIRVHDVENDVTKSYFHAPGDLCGGADTAAFAP
ncbi:MAG TPA: hypothetical protein VKU40_15185 [Thermoanaerobaculia bacterium]|nr:hypothetical protein [Thermoanaerobaculia bacterium]